MTTLPHTPTTEKKSAPISPVETADAPAILTVTAAAANKITGILAAIAAEDNDPSALTLKLRISVTGGGCSGLKYDFTFAKQPEDDDYTITAHGVTVLVDAISVDYLEGATIDYAEDPSGEQFIIRNPNASSSCGCGASFAAG